MEESIKEGTAIDANAYGAMQSKGNSVILHELYFDGLVPEMPDPAADVRASPHYPQAKGKLESWYGRLKQECIRTNSPATLEEARRRVAAYVEHDDHVRLHSALGYITPADTLNGLEQVIFAERDRKLEQALLCRQQARQSVEKVA